MIWYPIFPLEALHIYKNSNDKQLEAFLRVSLQDIWIECGESEEHYEHKIVSLIAEQVRKIKKER